MGILLGNLAEMKDLMEHNNKVSYVQSGLNNTINTTTDAEEDCSNCSDSDHCYHHCNGLHIVIISSTLKSTISPLLTFAIQRVEKKHLNPLLEILGQPPQLLFA
ncbi:MAG: hypothetical protein KDD46_06240 [Bdellovibrionales bacterium]|nr:hypothetical protein [Bdellovibrionales bacterium]